jgi:hypothetical protein
LTTTALTALTALTAAAATPDVNLAKGIVAPRSGVADATVFIAELVEAVGVVAKAVAELDVAEKALVTHTSVAVSAAEVRARAQRLADSATCCTANLLVVASRRAKIVELRLDGDVADSESNQVTEAGVLRKNVQKVIQIVGWFSSHEE